MPYRRHKRGEAQNHRCRATEWLNADDPAGSDRNMAPHQERGIAVTKPRRKFKKKMVHQGARHK